MNISLKCYNILNENSLIPKAIHIRYVKDWMINHMNARYIEYHDVATEKFTKTLITQSDMKQYENGQ